MKLKKYTKKRELLSYSFANLNLLLLLRCRPPVSSILLQNAIQFKVDRLQIIVVAKKYLRVPTVHQ